MMMENPCACEKDRSLCGGVWNPAKPLRMGFGLDVATLLGYRSVIATT